MKLSSTVINNGWNPTSFSCEDWWCLFACNLCFLIWIILFMRIALKVSSNIPDPSNWAKVCKSIKCVFFQYYVSITLSLIFLQAYFTIRSRMASTYRGLTLGRRFLRLASCLARHRDYANTYCFTGDLYTQKVETLVLKLERFYFFKLFLPISVCLLVFNCCQSCWEQLLVNTVHIDLSGV